MKLHVKKAGTLGGFKDIYPDEYILECVKDEFFSEEHAAKGPWEVIEVDDFDKAMAENAKLMDEFQAKQQEEYTKRANEPEEVQEEKQSSTEKTDSVQS